MTELTGVPNSATTARRSRSRTSGSSWRWLEFLRWLILVIAVIVSIFPAVYMVAVSLEDNAQFYAGTVFPWPWHFGNYADAWVKSQIAQLYFNSVFITTVSVVLTVAVSALAGYAFGRISFVGRSTVYSIILLGLGIPVSIALIPLFFDLKQLHLLNTPWSLIGSYTGFGLAFATFILRGFFETLPKELDEAARVDGANEWTIFSRIMLPLTRPALATVAIFLCLQNWNEFLFALTFITDEARRTLPTGIYALMDSEFYGNYPALCAALTIFSAPVLLLYFVFQSQFIAGLTAGAVKQ